MHREVMLLYTDPNQLVIKGTAHNSGKAFFLATLASHPVSTVPYYCPLAILVLHTVEMVGVRQEMTGKTIWKG